jgi:hypothetical protein
MNYDSVAVDFEFCQAEEKFVNPTSVAYQFKNYRAESNWLRHGEKVKKSHCDFFRDLFLAQKKVLLCFSAVAELRSLRALGFTKEELRQVQVFDCYVEWRQNKYNNLNWMYGTFFVGSRRQHSVPPSYNKKANLYRNNTEIGNRLVDCVGRLFEVNMDTTHKTQMRDLIIADLEYYSPEDVAAILGYGAGDVEYLHMIQDEFCNFQQNQIQYGHYFEAALRRGRFMVEAALMEEEGIPIDPDAVGYLCENYAEVIEELIGGFVKEFGPFYVRKKTSRGALSGSWKEDTKYFQNFVDNLDIRDEWPKTDTGKYSAKEETLESYGDAYPALYAYRQTKKNIKQISFFRPDGYKNIVGNIGSDYRLRVFLNPFGTQTSRNAPKPSHGFIPAMSSWLRCLIRPPKDEVIIAKDYGSQEFLIAALMSEDLNMQQSYASGDPYLAFAKLAGSVPSDAEPALVKDPWKVLVEHADLFGISYDADHGFTLGDLQKILVNEKLKEVYERFLAYNRTRGLFKAIVLGLQYGMGARLLAVKITADTGVFCTKDQAENYIEMHREAYPDYWEWLYAICRTYDSEGNLILQDGWMLLGDNDNALSVRNFPVQGTGAVIMREACIIAGDNGANLLYTLHDAIYSKAPANDVAHHEKILDDAMQQAVINVIGGKVKMRIDTDIHDRDHVWVEDKGRKHYELLNKYLTKQASWKEKEKAYMKKMGLNMSGYISPID